MEIIGEEMEKREEIDKLYEKVKATQRSNEAKRPRKKIIG